MDRYGYAKKLSTGIVAASGTLGCLIPPSVPLIIYGIITEQSIGKLFIAAVIPGLMVALFFMVIIYGWCRINPSLGPRGQRSSWSERITSLKQVAWVAVIFLIVMGGLMKGFFTPTEAGSVGAFSVGLLAIIKRDLHFQGFLKSTAEALRTACMVLLLMQGPPYSDISLQSRRSPWWQQIGFRLAHQSIYHFVLIGLVYLIGGSFIDDLAFMILATPIFYPVVVKLGYDLIWFGMFLHITVMIGVIIPPVAVNVFVVRNITKVPLWDISSGVLPFLLSLVFVIFVVPLPSDRPFYTFSVRRVEYGPRLRCFSFPSFLRMSLFTKGQSAERATS